MEKEIACLVKRSIEQEDLQKGIVAEITAEIDLQVYMPSEDRLRAVFFVGKSCAKYLDCAVVEVLQNFRLLCTNICATIFKGTGRRYILAAAVSAHTEKHSHFCVKVEMLPVGILVFVLH